MKNVILLFLLLCSFIGCKKVEKNVEIDNPSDKVVTISFNDQPEITLQPNEFKKVMIPFGDQKIIVNGGKPVEVYLDEKKNYLINPTYEEYYIKKVPYFTDYRAEDNYRKQYGDMKSKIRDMEFIGVDVSPLPKALVIQKQWDFGLEEEMTKYLQPQNRNINGGQNFYVSKKIIRFVDILKEIMIEKEEEFIVK